MLTLVSRVLSLSHTLYLYVSAKVEMERDEERRGGEGSFRLSGG